MIDNLGMDSKKYRYVSAWVSPEMKRKIASLKPKRVTKAVFNGDLLIAGLEEYERRLAARANFKGTEE